MNEPIQTQTLQLQKITFCGQGNVIRNRNVSPVVLTGQLDIPTPTRRLNADWEREIAGQLALEPGDVEALSLARSRLRWPDFNQCVQAMINWASAIGLKDVLNTSDMALMACRGARYHHDAEQYADKAFCNLFLSEDKGLDLHFPAVGVAGLRIPLSKGIVVVFDTAQPHAVIKRGATDTHGFKASDFPLELDCSQVFLTWELPIENSHVAQALGIKFQ